MDAAGLLLLAVSPVRHPAAAGAPGVQNGAGISPGYGTLRGWCIRRTASFPYYAQAAGQSGVPQRIQSLRCPLRPASRAGINRRHRRNHTTGRPAAAATKKLA